MNEPWTAWTLVARDGVMRVYRQGTYRGQVTYPVATMGDFYIGRHWWVDGGLRYSTRLRARVNDVRVFNRALNDADVFQLYSQLSPPPEPGAFEAWSTAQGLTGSAAEASADPDRDGFTNLQEYSFGTIPRQSTPALSDFRVTAASSIIDWLARPDVQYGAFSSLDLVRWGTAPFPITTAPNQAQVPAGYQRLQLELPLLDRYEEIDLFTVRIEAEASPVFNPGLPVTLTPPTGEAAPGDAISMSGAEAVNAISYQWYKNDVAIPGATRRTLELAAVTAEQTGSYSLMALNAAGQTRSAARFLNVRSPLPAVVTTGSVMNITGSTALASGTVNSDGGAAITSRGVVVGPAAEPTLVTGTSVSVSPGTGTFAAPLNLLQGKTTYYVRAFATTSAGTTYGSQVVFSTTESIPVVVTGAAVAGATFDSFTVSGDVTNDGGTPVTSRGIVYGLTAAPTLGAAMDAPAIGTGVGAFSSTLTGLSPETIYYARAYASSTVGTGYGAEITFKTAPDIPVGFALIPEGTFQMGDALDGINDAPVRQVTVSAFYMAQQETTKALWDEVRDWGGSRGYTDLRGGEGKASNHPVTTVSWFDIIKWCNARSEKEGLPPCYTVGGSPLRTGTVIPVVNWTAKGYRLPTEAEWEKAARCGLNGKRFPWGDTIVHSQANYYSENVYAYDISPTRGGHPTYAVSNQPWTSPVGSFAANGYGLYDMSGNVYEYCWDWYGNYDTGSPSDPRGASSGTYRVLRGGSWGNVPIYCRVAYRDYDNPSLSDINYGFRVARSSVP
jgi:formylglycine-generating enzyme required for sulfatase activity